MSRTRRGDSKKAKAKNRIEHAGTERQVFTVIKTSLSHILKSVSETADKAADVMTDNNGRHGKLKELTSTIETLTSDIKETMRDVNPKDILCDASFEFGKFSRIAKDRCTQIYQSLME